MNAELLTTIKNLYQEMLADTSSKSLSYRSMENSLRTFLLYADNDTPENRPRIEGTLALALAGAKSYLDSHKKVPATSTGRARVALAQALFDNYTQLEQELNDNKRDKNLQDNYTNDTYTARSHMDIVKEELNSLGRLHRGAATHIVPDYTPEVAHEGRGEKMYRAGVHGLTTLVRAIGFVIPGLFIRTWRAVRHIGRSAAGTQPVYEQEAHDNNRIPGSRNRESFEVLHPETADDNQPIIDDVRRVPLIWERQVLDDPNQPPTMTLKTKEATPDTLNSTDSSGDVGHAFITLSYTKTDPLTGRPARYETTFGFYPGAELGQMVLNNGNMNSYYLHAAASTLGTNGPGELMNDYDHYYDAGVTYPVTNKQINKVLCAAQDYAAKGYNMTTRNCASFVKEMASVAGLNADKFFEKVDFHLDAKSGAKSAGAALLADHFRNKVNGILREHTKTQSTQTYQTFGQKLVTEQDVAQMKTQNFNTRLFGYDPSHVAESMKNQTDYKIQNFAQFEKFLRRNNTSYTSDFSLDLTTAGSGLSAKISQYMQDRDQQDETLANEIAFLTQSYRDRIAVELTIGMDNNFSAYQRAHRPVPTGMNSYHARVEALKKASRFTKEFIDKLNSIYTDSLHSDPELRSSFAHLISELEFVRRDCESKKEEMDQRLISGELLDADSIAIDPKDLVQTNRECKNALNKFYTSYIDVTAASVLVFGDPNKYNVKYQREEELRNKEDHLTNDEKKELWNLRREIRVVPDMVKQQQYYARADHFSKGDIDFIFIDLPQKAPHHRDLNQVYQTFAWDHVFPDLRSRLTNALNGADRADRTAQLKAVSDVFANVLNHPSEERDNIINAIVRCQEEEKPFDSSMSASDYRRGMINSAAQSMCYSLIHCFFSESPMQELSITPQEMIKMIKPMARTLKDTDCVSKTLQDTMQPLENLRENAQIFYDNTMKAVRRITQNACSQMHNLYKSEQTALVHDLAQYIVGLSIAKIADDKTREHALEIVNYDVKEYENLIKAVERDKRFINAITKPEPLKFAELSSPNAFKNVEQRCAAIINSPSPAMNKKMGITK